ncbi:MAG TPA: hypothetical protein VG605_05275 [Puia sp.]|nr:hypothetical protein [Puia sp.]
MNRHFFPLLQKAFFLVGALFLGWTAQAQAQAQTTAPADSSYHQYGMHRWSQHPRIHYTPEQRKQFIAINKEYRRKAADLFAQDNLTLKQYKAGLLVLNKEKKDKLAALLTPRQRDLLAAKQKRMDENRQVMEAARLERLKLRLNLTDDQVAKLKAGQENLHSQVKAIHDNDNLLPRQKKEQMKTLLAKRNNTYKSVLTPEQYSQFEKMHHGFSNRDGFGPRGFEHGGRDGYGPHGFEHGSRRFGGSAGPGAPDGSAEGAVI